MGSTDIAADTARKIRLCRRLYNEALSGGYRWKEMAHYAGLMWDLGNGVLYREGYVPIHRRIGKVNNKVQSLLGF